MKILAVFIVLTICSTSLAHSTSGRKQKPKIRRVPVQNHPHGVSSFILGPKEFPGILPKPRTPYVDEENNAKSVSKEHPIRQTDVKQLGPRAGMQIRGRHVGVDQQDHRAEIEQHGHLLGAEQQARNTDVKQRGRHVGNGQQGRHVDEKNRGRQTRQSHNTFLAVQVPQIGNFHGGNPIGGGFQQGTQHPFPVGVGNLPGNSGNLVIPGLTILHPGASIGNHGGDSVFRPEPSGSFGQNGNFPFVPGTSTDGSQGISSNGGPGGSVSSSDSGLAGGLGGAFGAGYGFGLGGLIFGGPNGPVFAGNAGLNEGYGRNPEGAIPNDDVGYRNKQNSDGAPKERIPVFRPIPTRGNLLNGATKYNQVYRGVETSNPIPQHFNNSGQTPSTSSNSGETIGYVAFIFPKRNLPSANTAQPSHNSGTVKSSDAATTKTKAINLTASLSTAVNNRPAPTFVPVPVHIPIDRPYPVLVPKPYPVEILKPYPIAVPVREPVPYEVTRPISLPLSVHAEVTRPSQLPVLVGVNGVGSAIFQPPIETSFLHKRSDTTNREST